MATPMPPMPAYFAIQQSGNIKNGPSKFDLMLALFDRNSGNVRKVKFTLESEAVIECWISGVSIEDGSGESWMFEGHIYTNGLGLDSRVHGWFRTDGARSGWIKLGKKT